MKQEITKKIDEIADLISVNVKNNKRLGLLGGLEGEILFLSYYAKYKQSPQHNEIAFDALQELFDLINNADTQNPLYSSGLAGTGWLVNHLSSNDFIDLDSQELLTEFDSLFYEVMNQYLKVGEYDYLHRGLGLTFYYLERSDKKCNDYIAKAIQELDKTKIATPTGSYKWVSKRNNFDGTFTDEYNISLSHGLSSIVAILSKTLRKNIEHELSKDLLKGTINYILEQEIDFETYGSSFPSTSIESAKGPSLYSRLAWCYGDLGVASALFHASQTLQDKALEEKAISVFMRSVKRRDLSKNMVFDAGLCHGSAGIAHIYNRMFLNTQIKDFLETADYWFAETINIAKWQDGLAGYKSRKFWEEKESWENVYGYLEGIAGIGLAMISYVSDISPDWDSSLLLS